MIFPLMGCATHILGEARMKRKNHAGIFVSLIHKSPAPTQKFARYVAARGAYTDK